MAGHDLSFSVIMPSYNSLRYVIEAVESALGQMTEVDELVVQDGGSTDGTAQLLREFADKNHRVRLAVEKDSGQSDALNRALARSRNNYVLWLNADDLLLPDALRRVREALESADGPQVVTGGHQVLRADGEVMATYAARELGRADLMRKGCYIFSGSVAIRRDLLQQIGGFSTEFDYCMDLDLMFRLATSAESTVRIDAPVGALRRHDESKSGTASNMFLREGWAVRSRYIQGPSDQGRRLLAYAVQFTSIRSKPIRFSRTYAKIRGTIR